jgi:hypothetical protein
MAEKIIGYKLGAKQKKEEPLEPSSFGEWQNAL